jgi:hypothetical protein
LRARIVSKIMRKKNRNNDKDLSNLRKKKKEICKKDFNKSDKILIIVSKIIKIDKSIKINNYKTLDIRMFKMSNRIIK